MRTLVALLCIPSLALAQQATGTAPRVSDVVTPPPGDLVKVDAKQWTVEWGGTPRDPYVAPNGLIYFVGQRGNYVASLDQKTGAMKRFEIDSGVHPHTQIVDNDGMVWYAGNRAAHIGRIDPNTGKVTKYPMPDNTARDPHTMVFDGKGNIWFTSQSAGYVGRLNMASGKVDLVQTGQRTNPYGILMDKQGRPWFDLFATNKIGMVDPATMTLKEYPLPDAASRPRRIAMTSDGMIWYSDYSRGKVGRLDPKTGQVKDWDMPGGAQSRPYAINVDDKDRLWISETGGPARRLIGFDARQERFFAISELDARGGTVRHMMFDPSRREMWFGTDGGTVGKIVVP
jgi:virginiamycin B lyase